MGINARDYKQSADNQQLNEMLSNVLSQSISGVSGALENKQKQNLAKALQQSEIDQMQKLRADPNMRNASIKVGNVSSDPNLEKLLASSKPSAADERNAVLGQSVARNLAQAGNIEQQIQQEHPVIGKAMIGASRTPGVGWLASLISPNIKALKGANEQAAADKAHITTGAAVNKIEQAAAEGTTVPGALASPQEAAATRARALSDVQAMLGKSAPQAQGKPGGAHPDPAKEARRQELLRKAAGK